MGKIEEFLENFESKSTVSTYRYALNSFFKAMEQKPQIMAFCIMPRLFIPLKAMRYADADMGAVKLSFRACC